MNRIVNLNHFCVISSSIVLSLKGLRFRAINSFVLEVAGFVKLGSSEELTLIDAILDSTSR